MAYFLFIDDSGHDRVHSPYQVLAGMAVKDTDVWDLVSRIRALEVQYFGRRLADFGREIKAKRFLSKGEFKYANQMDRLPDDVRTAEAERLLLCGSRPTRIAITAFSQTKLLFVLAVLDLCQELGCKAFAAIIDKDTSVPNNRDLLRRDYVYFFERFYYYLSDADPLQMGVLVFDEFEKSRCHVLLSQIEAYFVKTGKGRQRCSQIIPDAFFVHSDLSVGVQLADLVAYIVSWGFRLPNYMQRPAREELEPYVERVCALRHLSHRAKENGSDFDSWSFTFVPSLQ